MSITYKSGGVNRQYSGAAVVIKDAAEVLHFFEASAEKSIGISGADTVSADAGTETYTVVGADSLGVSFVWGVNSPFSISGGVLTIPANSDGATANITLSFDGTTVASKAVTVTEAETEPDEPSGGETLKFTATKNGTKTGGILIELVPEAYTTADYSFSNHNPTTQNDWYIHKTTDKDSSSFTVSGVSGTLGDGFPQSVEIKKKETGTAIAFTREDISENDTWVAATGYSGEKFDAVFCSGTNIFEADTAYEVTLTWA